MHFVATDADASKATRTPTTYRAKEMGVVRQAKEMASQKVGEIPVSSKRHSVLPGLCVVLLYFTCVAEVLPRRPLVVTAEWSNC